MTDSTGLVYMRARFYNPRVMRFLNADPIGFAGGMNWYSFVGNNPLGFVDPWGLCESRSNSVGTYAKATFGPFLDGVDNIFYGTLYASFKAGQIGKWVMGEPNRWWEQDDEPSTAVARGFNWRGRAGWYDMNHPGPQFTRTIVEVGVPMKSGMISNASKANFSIVAESNVAQLALPAPRQIVAEWGANTYGHGGLMSTIEHIIYRHGFNSGFANVSRFVKGTTVEQIKGYVDAALRYGKVTQDGAKGFMIEHNFGMTIGTNQTGAAATGIRVFVRDGVIQTAFPISF
jgi:hypothetical protein